ncbi:MAG TPA: PHP domain-containing protein, partial [Abditibacteriaceae bacterium]|nr:PHP domain-containing protein [Abditibacteriaceae bacterium]
MSIDLHAHTDASDGSLSPTKLVELAVQQKLTVLGITDHDTIYGWDEAFAAGEKLGVEIVPGVELSTSYAGGRFHLLGYYVNPNSELIHVLERIQTARRNRNGEILENLRELGVPLEESEVRAFAGENGQLGRPHFAQAMIRRGYVATTQEAFDKYLADGQPAYATKAVLSPQEAIGLIHDAGGVSIWAHPPLNRNFTLQQLEEKLAEWKSWGLDGIETFYSRYTPE